MLVIRPRVKKGVELICHFLPEKIVAYVSKEIAL